MSHFIRFNIEFYPVTSWEVKTRKNQLFRVLLESIQWCDTYKCWNTCSNCNHWLDSHVYLKIPALVTTNMTSDVLTSGQTCTFFITTNMNGKCPEVSLQYFQLCHTYKCWNAVLNCSCCQWFAEQVFMILSCFTTSSNCFSLFRFGDPIVSENDILRFNFVKLKSRQVFWK